MHRLQTRRTITLSAQDILYFSLPGDWYLALNKSLGTLSSLTFHEGHPRMLVQQQFTRSELSLLEPLLEQYPNYCPHEVMFASFYNGSVTDQTIERARERLQEAFEYGTWDHEIRPMRNVISRIRLKLKDFGLDVHSLLETGYLLQIVPDEKAQVSSSPLA